jgi:hemerythrin-like metal-binding protein
MNLIEWREEFSIGLPEVDHEHRELIQHINALHAQLDAGADASHVAEILGDIHTEIAAHFALEEKSMKSLGYDDYAAHKSDHELLLDDILDILDEVHSTGDYEADALAERLSTWFGAHFRSHDVRLHHWLHRKH